LLSAFAARIAPLDAGLAAVLTAWEALPQAVRGGIVATAKALAGDRGTNTRTQENLAGNDAGL
jgi:hypothetical protein